MQLLRRTLAISQMRAILQNDMSLPKYASCFGQHKGWSSTNYWFRRSSFLVFVCTSLPFWPRGTFAKRLVWRLGSVGCSRLPDGGRNRHLTKKTSLSPLTIQSVLCWSRLTDSFLTIANCLLLLVALSSPTESNVSMFTFPGKWLCLF